MSGPVGLEVLEEREVVVGGDPEEMLRGLLRRDEGAVVAAPPQALARQVLVDGVVPVERGVQADGSERVQRRDRGDRLATECVHLLDVGRVVRVREGGSKPMGTVFPAYWSHQTVYRSRTDLK